MWHVGLGIFSSGLVRRHAVHSSGGASSTSPPYHWLSPDFRLLPSVERGALKLRIEKVRALITGRALEGDRIKVTGEIREPLASDEQVSLRVKNQKGAETLEYPVTVTREGGGQAFSVEVPVADVALVFHEGVDEKAQPEKRTWSTVLVATDPQGQGAPVRHRDAGGAVRRRVPAARVARQPGAPGRAGRGGRPHRL